MAEGKEESPRERQRKIARKTLENVAFQQILGSNQARTNPFLYGQLGVRGAEEDYAEAMGNDAVASVRKDLHENKKQQGESLGVYGTPNISDYDVSMQIIQQITENKALVTLGDLEEIAKSLAGGEVDFELPKQFRDKYAIDVMGKLAEKKPLSDDEKAVAGFYQGLSQIYDRATAVNATRGNYFSDIVDQMNQIAEKYKPKQDMAKAA